MDKSKCLNDYSVCELTLLPFKSYQSLVAQHLAAGQTDLLHFNLQRIGLEIDWKLNEYIKQALKPKTRQQEEQSEK
jgi:hypothetical protein